MVIDTPMHLHMPVMVTDTPMHSLIHPSHGDKHSNALTHPGDGHSNALTHPSHGDGHSNALTDLNHGDRHSNALTHPSHGDEHYNALTRTPQPWWWDTISNWILTLQNLVRPKWSQPAGYWSFFVIYHVHHLQLEHQAYPDHSVSPSHPIQHTTAGETTHMTPVGLVMAGCWQIKSILTNIGHGNSIQILNQYPFFWNILIWTHKNQSSSN